MLPKENPGDENVYTKEFMVHVSTEKKKFKEKVLTEVLEYQELKFLAQYEPEQLLQMAQEYAIIVT